MMNITAMLDPQSQAAIARLMDPELLDPAIINMLDQVGEDLQQAATDYMWATFRDTTGRVENSWETERDGPFLVSLTNTAPYARRLNESFSGMTDVLGRYYPQWPIGTYSGGYHWAEAAVEAVAPQVADVFRTQIDKTMEDI